MFVGGADIYVKVRRQLDILYLLHLETVVMNIGLILYKHSFYGSTRQQNKTK
jgi:hypothetical protein